MALSSNDLNGQETETIMSGQMAGISHIAEFSWYEWVMFWDAQEGYPEPKETQGGGWGQHLILELCLSHGFLRDDNIAMFYLIYPPKMNMNICLKDF